MSKRMQQVIIFCILLIVAIGLITYLSFTIIFTPQHTVSYYINDVEHLTHAQVAKINTKDDSVLQMSDVENTLDDPNRIARIIDELDHYELKHPITSVQKYKYDGFYYTITLTSNTHEHIYYRIKLSSKEIGINANDANSDHYDTFSIPMRTINSQFWDSFFQ